MGITLFNAIIPAQNYAVVFYNILLLLLIAVSLNLKTNKIAVHYNSKNNNLNSKILLITLLIFIGFRPLSVYFGDMGVYSDQFIAYSRGESINASKDIVWHMFMRFCATIMSSTFFFLTCASLLLNDMALLPAVC